MGANTESQANGCYQQLLQSIQRGQLKPGDYLREQVLAEELGVSRTPVREALRRLEAEGLLQSEPRF